MAGTCLRHRLVCHPRKDLGRLWPGEQLVPPMLGFDFLKDDRRNGFLILFRELFDFLNGLFHQFRHVSRLPNDESQIQPVTIYDSLRSPKSLA